MEIHAFFLDFFILMVFFVFFCSTCPSKTTWRFWSLNRSTFLSSMRHSTHTSWANFAQLHRASIAPTSMYLLNRSTFFSSMDRCFLSNLPKLNYTFCLKVIIFRFFLSNLPKLNYTIIRLHQLLFDFRRTMPHERSEELCHTKVVVILLDFIRFH